MKNTSSKYKLGHKGLGKYYFPKKAEISIYLHTIKFVFERLFDEVF